MLFFNMEKYYVLINHPVAMVFKMLYVLNYYIVW